MKYRSIFHRQWIEFNQFPYIHKEIYSCWLYSWYWKRLHYAHLLYRYKICKSILLCTKKGSVVPKWKTEAFVFFFWTWSNMRSFETGRAGISRWTEEYIYERASGSCSFLHHRPDERDVIGFLIIITIDDDSRVGAQKRQFASMARPACCGSLRPQLPLRLPLAYDDPWVL